MIAVDTSALLAIALNELTADACIAAIESEDEVIISAGTLTELFVVASRRHLLDAAHQLLDRVGMTVVSVTEQTARQVGNAYDRWGRGVHPAGLNFGDCFAYAVAKEHGCPLLFVGDDFAHTDVQSVL
ncbi:MAG: type II toxin-antitoxin system VapC family toxin [Dehalococcoidia bacterium]